MFANAPTIKIPNIELGSGTDIAEKLSIVPLFMSFPWGKNPSLISVEIPVTPGANGSLSKNDSLVAKIAINLGSVVSQNLENLNENVVQLGDFRESFSHRG